VKVTQDAIVDRQAILHIEVESPELEDHLDRAYKRLVGRVAIPGFRKGKAPRSVFERQYGRERLVEEALESLVTETVNKAIEQQGLEMTSTPHVAVEERQPLPKLKATVPLKPIVELGAYKSLRFADKPEAVGEDRIDSVINRAREMQATYEPVERPLEMTDMAVLGTVECKVEDRVVLAGTDVEYPMVADGPYPAPGFAAELVGLKAGDSREFSLRLPDDARDTAAAGKPGQFKVTVNAAKKKVLPEINDDFAKSLGEGVQSLDELRAKVRAELEKQAQDANRNVLENKAVDALVEATKFEIPPLLIEHQTEYLLYDQQEALSRYKISFQDYMQSTGKTGEQVIGETRENASRRVKRALVLEQLVKAEDVTVNDEEIDRELEQLRASARTPQEVERYKGNQIRGNVRSVLERRRALEILVAIVKEESPATQEVAQAQG